MEYLRHMTRILKLDATVYGELAAGALPMRYCMINVTALGVIYGLASIQFAKQLLAAQPDAAAAFNPLMILMVGVSIAFFMHGGLGLFVWVFCRGIGGSPQFMPTYLNIGMAAIALWPLAPAVSAFQVGSIRCRAERLHCRRGPLRGGSHFCGRQGRIAAFSGQDDPGGVSDGGLYRVLFVLVAVESP